MGETVEEIDLLKAYRIQHFGFVLVGWKGKIFLLIFDDSLPSDRLIASEFVLGDDDE